MRSLQHSSDPTLPHLPLALAQDVKPVISANMIFKNKSQKEEAKCRSLSFNIRTVVCGKKSAMGLEWNGAFTIALFP
jgi:hypothetical protein